MTKARTLNRVLAIVLVMITIAAVLSLPAQAAYSTGSYTITAKSGLNMRQGAGTNYRVLTGIPYNKTVTVTKTSGIWGYTTYNGRSGWISLQYAKYQAPATTTKNVNYQVKVSTTSGLNLRKGSGTGYASLLTIPYNKVLTITKESNGWGYTSYNGKYGWVSLTYTAKYTPGQNAAGAAVNMVYRTLSARRGGKISFSFDRKASDKNNGRTTSGTVSVNGTTIKAGSTFYTYGKVNGKWTASTSGNYNVYKYAKIGGNYVNVAAAQCYAYARYIQQLLYGTNESINGKKFNFSYYYEQKMTANNVKAWVTAAGAGAHIRTNGHSLVVLETDSNGFYFTDANATSGNNIVCVGYYTWSSFVSRCNAGWGGCIRYISTYIG